MAAEASIREAVELQIQSQLKRLCLWTLDVGAAPAASSSPYSWVFDAEP